MRSSDIGQTEIRYGSLACEDEAASSVHRPSLGSYTSIQGTYRAWVPPSVREAASHTCQRIMMHNTHSHNTHIKPVASPPAIHTPTLPCPAPHSRTTNTPTSCPAPLTAALALPYQPPPSHSRSSSHTAPTYADLTLTRSASLVRPPPNLAPATVGQSGSVHISLSPAPLLNMARKAAAALMSVPLAGTP